MALINCKECGKEISDKASSCPNCGAPVVAAAQPNVFTQASTPPKGMTKCEACGKEIAKNAPFCPHCGKNRLNRGWKKGCLILIGLIILFILLIVLIVNKS